MGIGTFLRERREEREEDEARQVVQDFVGKNQTDPEAARSMYPDVVNALITLKRTIPSAMLGGGTPGEAAKAGALGDAAAEWKFRTQGPSLAAVGEPAQLPGTVGAPDIYAPRPAGGQLKGLSNKDLLSFLGGKAMSPEISAKEMMQKAALPQAIEGLSKGIFTPQIARVFDMNPVTFQEAAAFTIQQKQNADPKYIPTIAEKAAASGADGQEQARLQVFDDYMKGRVANQELYDMAGLTISELERAHEYTKALLAQNVNPLKARRDGLRMAAIGKTPSGLPSDKPTPEAARAERESLTREREQVERTRIAGAHLELAKAGAKDAARRFDEAQALRLTSTQQNTMESVRQGLQLLGIYDAKTGGLDYGKILEHKHLENPIVFGLVDLLREQILKGGIPELSVPYVDVDEKGKSYIRWTTQDDYNFGVRQGTIKKRTPK